MNTDQLRDKIKSELPYLCNVYRVGSRLDSDSIAKVVVSLPEMQELLKEKECECGQKAFWVSVIPHINFCPSCGGKIKEK